MGTASSSSLTAQALRIDARRKLIPIEFFSVVHGLPTKDALELIDDGTLHPAFNLALRSEGRRKIHLWRGMVESYEPGRFAPRLDVAEVIARILPPLGVAPASAVTVRGSDLCYRRCCSFARIGHLIRAGELCVVGKRPVNASPQISYESAARWLERRVV